VQNEYCKIVIVKHSAQLPGNSSSSSAIGPAVAGVPSSPDFDKLTQATASRRGFPGQVDSECWATFRQSLQQKQQQSPIYDLLKFSVTIRSSCFVTTFILQFLANKLNENTLNMGITRGVNIQQRW
jgi:hypothetical protein